MDKLKGSILAKAIAWVLITVSVATLVLSVIASYYITGLNVYENKLNDVRSQQFDQISDRYSAMALDWMGSASTEIYFADKNFNYGIIEAKNQEAFEKLDLNDPDIYTERNFTEKISEDDLNIFTCEIGPDTSISYDESLFGSYYIHFGSLLGNTVYITDYMYDTNSGIFYFYTLDGNYIPIKEITLKLETIVMNSSTNTYDYTASEVTFCYDTNMKQYCLKIPDALEVLKDTIDRNEEVSGNESTSAQTDVAVIEKVTETAQTDVAATEKVTETAQTVESSTAALDTATTRENYQKAIDVLSQPYFTFNQLDGTPWSYINWTDIKVSDGESVTVNKALADIFIDNLGGISADQFLMDASYTMNSDTEIFLENSGSGQPVNYYVISYVTDPLKNTGSWWTDDLYVKTDKLVTLAYQFRYSIYVILLISLVIAVLCFNFLIAAAGHRKNTEEIVLMWWDKIPFDLYLAVAAILEFFCLFVCANGFSSHMQVFYIVLLGTFIFCGGVIALTTILSFAVRVKAGKWWRNTVIYQILFWIKKQIERFGNSLTILWKAGVIFGAISILEFILMSVCLSSWSLSALYIMWFFEKLIIFVLGGKYLVQMKQLQEGSRHMAEGDLQYQIDTNGMPNNLKIHGENLNHINEGISRAVDEKMKSERFKTELITNVSHDIKTPLTSIINYVDLLEKEEIHNPNVEEYLEVLDRQSARLKKLIEDLIEASKASTGNLSVNLEKLEAGVFLVQTVGEFEEKTKAKQLELIIQKPEEAVYIMADGRHFWRVIDNLMNNICKYAQPGTRVYINLTRTEEHKVEITFRNTSKYPLNITSDELMERFVRGDSSRNTEGNGLGLSIARSLMELMKAELQLYVDGDLFKVVLTFEEQEKSDTV